MGDYRTRGVGITGTNWRLKLPSECNYDEELKEILKIENSTERCLTLFCWIQRSQMFLDGNKRVTNLITNKELIKNGCDILAMSVKKISEYLTYLIGYYETIDNTKLKMRLYDICLDGI